MHLLTKKIYPRILQTIVNVLLRTNRCKVTGERHLTTAISDDKPVIICAWHGELLYTSFYLHQYGLEPSTIISTHKDGEILSSLLEIWKFQPIRGSSSQRSTYVAKQLMSLFKNPDAALCLTCDGPRGPRRQAKVGSLKIAQRSGATLIALAGSSSSYWTLKSWDQFRIPKPFGRIRIVVSKPFKWPDHPMTDQALSKVVSDFISTHQAISEKI